MKLLLQPDLVYHIYNHANGHENLFNEDKNYNYFLDKYSNYIEPIAKTFSYCLMPNHFHFMIRVRDENTLNDFFHNSTIEKTKKFNHQTHQGFQTRKNINRETHQGFETLDEFRIPYLISNQFSKLFNGYTQAFNKMYGRRGSLFQSNFRRKEVDSDEYFTELIRYIHHNPVHHGFVKSPHSWPYSSIHELSSDDQKWVSKSEVIQWFGSMSEFLKFHSSPPNFNIIQRYHFDD